MRKPPRIAQQKVCVLFYSFVSKRVHCMFLCAYNKKSLGLIGELYNIGGSSKLKLMEDRLT